MNRRREEELKSVILASSYLRGRVAGLEDAIRRKIAGNEITYEIIDRQMIEYLVANKALTYEMVNKLLAIAKKDDSFLQKDVVEYLKRLSQSNLLVTGPVIS